MGLKENKKVKNARKVDINGNPIVGLKQWKESNPDELYFDSRLELYCYKLLKASPIDFEYKPKTLTLVEKQEAIDWEYSIDQIKDLRDLQRGVVDKNEKSANTRSFNSRNKKSLTKVKMPAWTWSPDFYLGSLKMYVDTKGNKKDAHWRNKLKTARNILKEKDTGVIQLQTQKEVREFINFIVNYEE